MKQKKGAAPVAAETTPKPLKTKNGTETIISHDPVENLPQNFPLVKYGRTRAEQLRRLHFTHNIPGNDLVHTVQKISPRFGKSELSKAENSESYGIEISADALKALWLFYAPEEYEKMKRQKDGHRLTKRLSCRVDDKLYDLVQKYIKLERIDVNTFLNNLIIDYFYGFGGRNDG